MKDGVVVIGKGPAGRAAASWLCGQGGLAGWVASARVRRVVPLAGGWRVSGDGWQLDAGGVLLTAGGVRLWRALGGTVVRNPAIGRLVPVPGAVPGIEVAGAALGLCGVRALEKSGRFRARSLWRVLDSGTPPAIYET